MVELSPLRAIGHFTLWFLVGHLLFLALRAVLPRRSVVQLYGPLIPFALGTYAALPYLAQMLGWLEPHQALSPLANVFLFYPLTEQHNWVRKAFGNFHVNVVLLGLSYLHLVLHYVRLIVRLERDPRYKRRLVRSNSGIRSR